MLCPCTSVMQTQIRLRGIVAAQQQWVLLGCGWAVAVGFEIGLMEKVYWVVVRAQATVCIYPTCIAK